MKKHYETHVEDTDKLISVAGPVLDYKSWYEQYRKLMEEQAQRKYGLYTPTSEGDDDDFPSIPGMIARYSASGLTNEQMAANPVWVDKTGNGHDLQLKNLAWAGMSGVGGYKYDFLSNDWNADVNQLSVVLSHKIVIINKRTSVQLIKSIRNELENTVNIMLKITGLEANGSAFKVYDNVDSSHAQEYNKDGIYQINYTATEGASRIYFYVPGGNMGQLENPITIEQLPLYPGALVFDGVDDYGTCDNFPILTKEKGYTVVALRQWITYNPNAISAIATNASDQSFNGAFTFENYNKGAEQTISYGATQITLQYSKSPFSWQTTSKYNGVNIANGNKDATNSLVLGRSYPQRNEFANFAIWELVFLDHDATEEELTKIKDYFVKTYPWLFPDQAWTVVGKTNEDEDRATIANITGNGNDLILSNLAFSGNSGYGSYVYNFNSFTFGEWEIIASDIKSNSFKVTGTGIGTNRRICAQTGESSVANWHIKVSGMKSGDIMYIGNANKGGDYLTIEKDGQYHFEKTFNKVSPNGIWYQTSNETDILIEQIPEYEGYLVTDGVDDSGRAVGLTISKDFTLVGEWILFSKTSVNAGLSIHPQIHIFNRPEAIQITFRTAGKTLPVKSLKAICSDGRCYDENWSELKINVGEFTGNKGTLFVASNGTNYAQIAFKNLGIYDNQILSKDDCIKAYNYLQTLKAK